MVSANFPKTEPVSHHQHQLPQRYSAKLPKTRQVTRHQHHLLQGFLGKLPIARTATHLQHSWKVSKDQAMHHQHHMFKGFSAKFPKTQPATRHQHHLLKGFSAKFPGTKLATFHQHQLLPGFCMFASHASSASVAQGVSCKVSNHQTDQASVRSHSHASSSPLSPRCVWKVFTKRDSHASSTFAPGQPSSATQFAPGLVVKFPKTRPATHHRQICSKIVARHHHHLCPKVISYNLQTFGRPRIRITITHKVNRKAH